MRVELRSAHVGTEHWSAPLALPTGIALRVRHRRLGAASAVAALDEAVVHTVLAAVSAMRVGRFEERWAQRIADGIAGPASLDSDTSMSPF